HPSHEVFHIQNADNMLRTALRIVDRDPRMLFADHPSQGVFEAEISGQGKNVGPRHHDLSNRRIVEFERVVNHLFLELRDLSETAAGGYDQLQFVWRMHGAPSTFSHLVRAEQL